MFQNFHTVLGVFKGLLGDPFIVKLFYFIVGFRWCKPCVNFAGSGGGGAGFKMCSLTIAHSGLDLAQLSTTGSTKGVAVVTLSRL